MTDQSLARFTRPHEPDTTELVLSRGERLPAHIVKRAMEALQVTVAYLQDSSGSFVSVRPQPALARELLTNYLEKLLNIEVPGRADPDAVTLLFTAEVKYDTHSERVTGTATDVVQREPFIMQPAPDTKIHDTIVAAHAAVNDVAGVYSSPREQIKPTRRFDQNGAPY